MKGTLPVPADLSMANLASRLTIKEQLTFVQLVGLAPDPERELNLATYIDQPEQLGALAIVGKGASSPGTKILSTTAYVLNAKAAIDVYRLPLY
jgi:hypothetical protein